MIITSVTNENPNENLRPLIADPAALIPFTKDRFFSNLCERIHVVMSRIYMIPTSKLNSIPWEI